MSTGSDRPPDPPPEGSRGRPSGLVSLLGGEAPPPGRRPDEREPPAGGSTHSSFYRLTPPREDFDPVRARTVCAEITRDQLRDFAPGLVLLSAASRRRAQALFAYARTLLDFAADATLEGERLAQINRWQFGLEEALAGEPPGQPVFVAMAGCHAEEPWPPEPLDELAALARRRVSAGRPATGDDWSRANRALVAAVWTALTGEPCPRRALAAGEAALRLRSLLGWHDRLFHTRPDLGLGGDYGAEAFRRAVGSEIEIVRALLEESAGPGKADGSSPRCRELGRTLHFASGGTRILIDRIEAGLGDAGPPRLGAAARVRLLLAARLFG